MRRQRGSTSSRERGGAGKDLALVSASNTMAGKDSASERARGERGGAAPSEPDAADDLELDASGRKLGQTNDQGRGDEVAWCF